MCKIQPASAAGKASAVSLAATVRQKSWNHVCEVLALIETVLELCQVTRHMLATNRMVAAGDGGLDVAQRRFDSVEHSALLARFKF